MPTIFRGKQILITIYKSHVKSHEQEKSDLGKKNSFLSDSNSADMEKILGAINRLTPLAENSMVQSLA